MKRRHSSAVVTVNERITKLFVTLIRGVGAEIARGAEIALGCVIVRAYDDTDSNSSPTQATNTLSIAV